MYCTPLNDVGFLLFVYLKSTLCLFATEHNDVLKKEMLEKAKELVALREEDFALHPKSYWPQVVKDIKDIFKMIKEVESGKDWQEAWIEIRK